MEMSEEKVETITKVKTEPAVVAHLHSDGISGHADHSAPNGVITRYVVANGEVASKSQIKGDKEVKLPVFPKAGAGIGKWLPKFFPQAIDVECITVDPDGAIRLMQAVKWLLEQTRPKEPVTKTFGEA